jgi:hypothetical protein
MSWQEEENARAAARLRRDIEFQAEYHPGMRFPAADRPPPPYLEVLADDAPYPRARSGRDPEELLREAGDPVAIGRQLEVSYIPGGGITTPAREAARRAEARRLRAERTAAELGYERARAAEAARQRALDRAMEAGFPRVTEFRAEPWS